MARLIGEKGEKVIWGGVSMTQATQLVMFLYIMNASKYVYGEICT